MIINLPSNFAYEAQGTSGYGYAYVDKERKKLILKGNISYSRVITKLMYDLNEHDICPYCGCKLSKATTTLDHCIPVDRGGPTIPENLIICCSNCNEEKGNMNKEEYLFYRSLKTNSEKIEYEKYIQKNLEKTKMKKGCDIPDEWTVDPKEIDIFVSINFRENIKRSKKYQKVKKNYKKYGKLIYPIISDENGILLDGFYSLMYSKENNISDITIIKLDNVERRC